LIISPYIKDFILGFLLNVRGKRSLQIKSKGGFYYLQQSYRDTGVKNYEKYIGKIKPTASIIEEFINDYAKFRWGTQLEIIKNDYNEIIKKLPLTVQSKNMHAFGIRFTHNTNKIEGSSLSGADTRSILELDQVPADSDINDVIEVKSHMQVYEMMIAENRTLSLDMILDWHKRLFQLTKPTHAGAIRNAPVFIGGSKFTPPPSRDEIDILLNEVFTWYPSKSLTYIAVYTAALMHFRFVLIHPFEDGNGRITRLLMNYILYQNGWPMFDLDPKHRIAYYNALERANLKDDEMYFISWFIPRYIKYATKTLESLGVKKRK
jgi:Fic family protein